jgi:hypothetical protein
MSGARQAEPGTPRFRAAKGRYWTCTVPVIPECSVQW